MAGITLDVNGERRTVEADPGMPLLWALRDLLQLTGTKYGCGIGQCGACTVLMDGKAVRSCMTPLSSVAERPIVTIEGLRDHLDFPLQDAWIESSVPQCGYCQAGQLMQAANLLTRNDDPTDEEINAAMTGNLCRCGTYQRIRRAIRLAAERSRGR